jgi:uncharacterized heparinase superfamily protein
MLRYWHTLRWLRPVQIVGRVWFRLYRPCPDLRPAPPLATRSGRWHACARAPSLVGPETLRLLSVERRIATATDWNNPDWPKLWLYNAHYFDDLVAEGAEARTDWQRALIARWIAENPPGQGNGWEPYPTSLRIVNWLKWLMAGQTPVPGMLDSLAVQTRWLRRRLEHHLLGNHLWANAKALIFAGACFDGEHARRWRQHGLHLLRRELAEQILPDGGHFERSPMYHALLTEDLLDLVQLAQRVPGMPASDVEDWRQASTRMLDWLGAMTHPDGEIAFFNDAAFGIAPPLAALRAYAQALGLALSALPGDGVRHLAATGYARLQRGPALLLADVAPVGPDYLPGHAHADTLSFELSLHGRRVLVNGGTSTYDNDAERLRQRGTAAHNTVVVDGQDSSEVWAAFRVARRARVHAVQLDENAHGLTLSARHDGYCRLPGRVWHQRRWQLTAQGVVVDDALDGAFEVAEAHYLFAPGAETALRWQVEGGEARMEDTVWCPRFGQAVPTRKLVVRFLQPRCVVTFHWN